MTPNSSYNPNRASSSTGKGSMNPPNRRAISLAQPLNSLHSIQGTDNRAQKHSHTSPHPSMQRVSTMASHSPASSVVSGFSYGKRGGDAKQLMNIAIDTAIDFRGRQYFPPKPITDPDSPTTENLGALKFDIEDISHSEELKPHYETLKQIVRQSDFFFQMQDPDTQRLGRSVKASVQKAGRLLGVSSSSTSTPISQTTTSAVYSTSDTPFSQSEIGVSNIDLFPQPDAFPELGSLNFDIMNENFLTQQSHSAEKAPETGVPATDMGIPDNLNAKVDSLQDFLASYHQGKENPSSGSVLNTGLEIAPSYASGPSEKNTIASADVQESHQGVQNNTADVVQIVAKNPTLFSENPSLFGQLSNLKLPDNKTLLQILSEKSTMKLVSIVTSNPEAFKQDATLFDKISNLQLP